MERELEERHGERGGAEEERDQSDTGVVSPCL